jgi:hypothetical protein
MLPQKWEGLPTMIFHTSHGKHAIQNNLIDTAQTGVEKFIFGKFRASKISTNPEEYLLTDTLEPTTKCYCKITG